MINSAFKPWIYWYSSPGIKEDTRGAKGGQLSFLNKSQIKEIDVAGKEILNKTGVKIPNKVILERLEQIGSKVNHKEERVWIPPALVNEALDKTPKIFKFAGRDPKNYISLDTGRPISGGTRRFYETTPPKGYAGHL
jgi:trimethylamine:corrinoid methyltransferase-like protein